VDILDPCTKENLGMWTNVTNVVQLGE
jgi:hypothetical protein